MNNVIDSIIDGLENIKAMDISDDEKAAHITGIMNFSNIIIQGKLDETTIQDK